MQRTLNRTIISIFLQWRCQKFFISNCDLFTFQHPQLMSGEDPDERKANALKQSLDYIDIFLDKVSNQVQGYPIWCFRIDRRISMPKLAQNTPRDQWKVEDPSGFSSKSFFISERDKPWITLFPLD